MQPRVGGGVGVSSAAATGLRIARVTPTAGSRAATASRTSLASVARYVLRLAEVGDGPVGSACGCWMVVFLRAGGIVARDGADAATAT